MKTSLRNRVRPPQSPYRRLNNQIPLKLIGKARCRNVLGKIGRGYSPQCYNDFDNVGGSEEKDNLWM